MRKLHPCRGYYFILSVVLALLARLWLAVTWITAILLLLPWLQNAGRLFDKNTPHLLPLQTLGSYRDMRNFIQDQSFHCWSASWKRRDAIFSPLCYTGQGLASQFIDVNDGVGPLHVLSFACRGAEEGCILCFSNYYFLTW